MLDSLESQNLVNTFSLPTLVVPNSSSSRSPKAPRPSIFSRSPKTMKMVWPGGRLRRPSRLASLPVGLRPISPMSETCTKTADTLGSSSEAA